MSQPSRFDILQSGVPARDIDEKWQQRTHQLCGGELVVITKQAKEAICCKKCRAMWNLGEDYKAPVDWSTPDPLRAGPGLWVPGKIA